MEAVDAIKTSASKSGRSVPLKRMPPLHGCQSEGVAARKNSRHEEYDSGCPMLSDKPVDVESPRKVEEKTAVDDTETNNNDIASL